MTITKSNVAVASDGGIFGPVDATETWATHFTSHAWTTPQDQINAGYAQFAQPALTAGGYYEEDFDTGTTIDAALISLSASSELIAGSPTITYDISYRLTTGDAWTTVTGVTDVYATNFRYIKVKANFGAAAQTDLIILRAFTVRIMRQQKFVDFTKDLGAGKSSGTFDVTGLSGLNTSASIMVLQTSAAIASKGNARDEPECDPISVSGYALNSTTIRCYWNAPSIVVGIYAFAYMTP